LAVSAAFAGGALWYLQKEKREMQELVKQREG
jgi:hypothetical protein